MHQGDLMIWKSAAKRKTYVDGRSRFFPQSLLEDWHKIRKALSEDEVADWKPSLDKYNISAVMIEPAEARVTYGRLLHSPNWVPFYDDGRIVMFGRADAPATDLAFFKANELNADLRVSHEAAGYGGGAASQPDFLDRRRVPESDLQPAAIAAPNRLCAGSTYH